MKKQSIWKALGLAAALALSVSVAACGGSTNSASSDVTSADASGNASGDASGDAGGVSYVWDESETEAIAHVPTVSGEVTIAGVEYGADYVATEASGDDTINSPSASSNIVAVDLAQDGKTVETIEATAGGVLTMTITEDGKYSQQDILDWVEDGNSLDASMLTLWEMEVTDEHSEMGKFGNMTGQTAEYTYRSALKVEDGSIVKTQSIEELFDGDLSDSGIDGGSLYLDGAFFNGIIATGSSDFSVSSMIVEANGDGANDFQGCAAAILADSDATIEISDTYIKTAGVIRTAAAAKENGILKIDGSVIYTEETADTNDEYEALVVPMMKRTPFALGIEGVVRATNILGAGQGIYTNSLIVSSGWGVLSTDSGTVYDQVGTYALDVSDTVAGIGSVEIAQTGKDYDATFDLDGTTYGFTQSGSGYVAYADSGVWDKFDNVKFYSDDYVQIMASSTSSAYYTNSELTSGRIAVMTQQNAGGTISIKDSTVNAGDTVVQVKSGAANAGYTNIILDNADISFGNNNIWGQTLVELVESDDAGNPGNTEYEVNDTGDEAVAGAAELDDTNATLTNGDYTGNIWNNIYNNTENLNVTVDNATVTGTISSAYGYHLNDDGTRMENGTILHACTEGDYRTSDTETNEYLKIGAQYNVASAQVNNPVNVTLTNGSTWNVVLADGSCGEADACYVNDLTVEDGCTLDSNSAVTIYVYGSQDIQGTVGSNVTIKEASVDESASSDDGVAATTQFYDGTAVEFVVLDADGNPSKNSAKVDYKAFTDTIGFTVDADADITADNAKVSEGNDNGYDYTLTNNSGNTDTVTVTIQLK